MANNLIQIKRSLTTATPGSLANGELAYTANGDVLFIGSNGGVVAIGGARNPGTLTANQALVANSTLGIDRIVVANAAVTRLTANGTSSPGAGYYLAVDSGGNTFWAAPGTLSINVNAQYVWTNTHSFTNTTSSSSTTTGAVVIAGGLGVGGRINTLDLAAGNSTVYTTVNGTSVSTVDVFSTGAVNAVTLSVGNWVVANNGGVWTSGRVNGAIVSVGTSFSANTTRVSIGTSTGLEANGGIGTAGQLLTSNGTTVYWSTPPASVAGSDTQIQYNDGGTLAGDAGLTYNKTTDTLTVAGSVLAGPAVNAASHTIGSTFIANTTGVYHTGAVNAASLAVGTNFIANTTRVVIGTAVGLQANGGIGTAGQVLTSNATTVYWSTPTTGTVTSVATGNGLTGGTITSTGTIAVVANSGIAANSTGVFVVAGTDGGLVSNSTGVFVSAGSGLVSNSTGLHVGAANGISVGADTVGLTTGSTLTVNSTGAHVNSTLSITSLSLSGDLVVAGNVTTTTVNSIKVSDPLIYLAGNNNVADTLDIGFAGQYYDGAASRWTGLFRDHGTNNYRLFANTTQDLSGNNDIDTAAVGYTVATLYTYLNSGALVSNSAAVTITANSTVNVNITANSLTLSTPLAATSGGVGIASYTSGDILVANTGNVLSKLSLGTSGRVLQSNGTALVYDTLDGGTF